MRIDSLYSQFKNRLNREEVYTRSEYWDAKARLYQGNAVSMWPNAHLNFHYNKKTLSLLDASLKDVAGKKILDIGCGTGRLTQHLAGKGANVTGLDFSQETINVAKKFVTSPNAHLICQSIYDFDAFEEYDAIVSGGILAGACKNEKDLALAMRKFHRALKPSGILFLTEAIHRGFLHRVLNLNVEEFCTVMQKEGFEILKKTAFNFWPFRLLLAFLPIPKVITTFFYHLGEKILSYTPRKQTWGDYTAIFAVKESSYTRV